MPKLGHTKPRSISALLLLLAVPAAANDIQVDATCTLVQAIEAANNDDDRGGLCPPGGSGADTLYLTRNVSLTEVNNRHFRDEPNGLPPITSDITIEGAGFVIERAPDSPGFRIVFVDLTGDLTLNDVTVQNGGDVFIGAGIFARGPVAITNSTITENSAEISVGAVRTGRAGGIAAYEPLTITNSTVSNNVAGSFGGGILAFKGMTMSHSTVSDNYAGDQLGGVVLSVQGDSRLSHSTISGNAAGSAIRQGDALAIAVPSATLSHVTLTGRSSEDDRNLLHVFSGTVYVSDSIVANGSSVDSCLVEAEATWVDDGNNFDDDGSCPGAARITPGVDFDTVLADNGGPTLTHALREGSVAIDAAAICDPPYDQRGYRRSDAICDSGAYEAGAVACATCVDPRLLVGFLSDLRLVESCRNATCHDPDGLLALEYLLSLEAPAPGDGYYYLQ